MFTSIRRTIVATGAALTLGLGGALWATSAASAAPAAVPACATGSLAVWVNLSAAASRPAPPPGRSASPTPAAAPAPCADTRASPPPTPTAASSAARPTATRPTTPTTVTIPAGGTAHAYLLWTEVANFPSGCNVTTASLLKVYPPGRRSAADAFFSLPVCRSTRPLYQYLFVTVVQPGVGRAL